MRQSWSVNNLTDFIVDSVQAAHADEAPFYHLKFDRVFSNLPTVFRKALQSSFICRRTSPHRISELFFTRCSPTGENQRRRRCHSRLTAVMHSRLPITRGIRPTRWEPK